MGKVQNAAGKFVKADLASVTAAAAGAAKDMPDDFRVSITNAPGADCLSDFQLHLAADSRADSDAGKAGGHQGLF